MLTRGARARAVVGSTLVGAALALTAAVPASAGAAPQPTYGSAVVDGNASEWNAGDQWGTLRTDGPDYRDVASASVRYDCGSGTLFVLVQALPGFTLQTLDPEEDYVRIGQDPKLVSGLSGNDGVAPDFAYVSPGGDTAAGFEASAKLDPGTYPASLRIHAKFPDDSADTYETADLLPRYADLVIECATPPTTTPTSPPSSAVVVPNSEGPTTTPTAPTAEQGPTVSPINENLPNGETGTGGGGPQVLAASEDNGPGVLSGTLARTGSELGPLAAVGALLVLCGAALVHRARRLPQPFAH